METSVRTHAPRSMRTPVADGAAEAPLVLDLLRKMDAYWRAANYLSVGGVGNSQRGHNSRRPVGTG